MNGWMDGRTIGRTCGIEKLTTQFMIPLQNQMLVSFLVSSSLCEKSTDRLTQMSVSQSTQCIRDKRLEFSQPTNSVMFRCVFLSLFFIVVVVVVYCFCVSFHLILFSNVFECLTHKVLYQIGILVASVCVHYLHVIGISNSFTYGRGLSVCMCICMKISV